VDGTRHSLRRDMFPDRFTIPSLRKFMSFPYYFASGQKLSNLIVIGPVYYPEAGQHPRPEFARIIFIFLDSFLVGQSKPVLQCHILFPTRIPGAFLKQEIDRVLGQISLSPC